jgi:hypothetical protein
MMMLKRARMGASSNDAEKITLARAHARPFALARRRVR